MSPHEYFYILSAVQIYNNFNFLQYLATDPSVSSKLYYVIEQFVSLGYVERFFMLSWTSTDIGKINPDYFTNRLTFLICFST